MRPPDLAKCFVPLPTADPSHLKSHVPFTTPETARCHEDPQETHGDTPRPDRLPVKHMMLSVPIKDALAIFRGFGWASLPLGTLGPHAPTPSSTLSPTPSPGL